MGTVHTSLVSVEEYLARTEKPNAEYEDGIVYVKPTPTGPHSLIMKRLIELLDAQHVISLPELTVQISPRKYLVPDVAVVREIPARYPTEPIRLAIEILSPEQGLGDMLAKCEKYHAWGVPYCWVVDPDKRTAWEYHSGGEPVKMADALHAGELTVALADLFEGLR